MEYRVKLLHEAFENSILLVDLRVQVVLTDRSVHAPQEHSLLVYSIVDSVYLFTMPRFDEGMLKQLLDSGVWVRQKYF